MSYFNDTLPADTEPVKTGASRVRALQTALNTLVAQIFNDAGAFLSKWVTGGMLADGAVGAGQIAAGAVGAGQLAGGALSADTTGRAKMADGFLTVAKLAPGFAVPAGSVGATQIADGGVVASKLAAGAVTVAAAAVGVAKSAVGTYTGSGSAAAVVAGLAFAPDVVLIVRSGTNQVFVALRAEAGPLHLAWDGGVIVSPFATAVTWAADGFTVVPFGVTANAAGSTYTFLALKA